MLPPQIAWGWRAAIFAVTILFLISLIYAIALLAGGV